MKITKGLLPFLLFILMSVTLLTGCSHVDKTDVEAVITNELDLLKNLDSDTTQKYVSYKELFPDTTEEIQLSNEVKEFPSPRNPVFLLYLIIVFLILLLQVIIWIEFLS